ncbi:OVCH1 protein, partial [Campylorhamphus procurvoides]|nr:OVCH1 protein [Campylorhamphus procurvoides]
QMKEVKPTMVCPHLGMLSYHSNTALMDLDISLEYSAALRPVCLPSSTETLSSSSLYAVSGWGLSKKVGPLILLPVLESEICEINCYFSYPGGITARMLCAGFVSVRDQDS